MRKSYCKRLYLFFFLLLCQDALKAQVDTVFMRFNAGGWDSLHYVTDTLIFPSPNGHHILKGTTVLPWTGNQENAKAYSLYLANIIRSDCPKTSGDQYMEHGLINSITLTDTSLVVDIKIFENCCYDFLADVSVDTAGIINLIYHGYGSFCFCQCCFGLTYYFQRVDYPDVEEISAVIINGDQRTRKELRKK